MQFRPLRTGLLASLSLALAGAAQPVLDSFDSNGRLAWSNQQIGAQYVVQWAAALTGTWHGSWQTLDDLAATSASRSVDVPMFYRVGQLPTTGLVAHYPLTLDAADISTNGLNGSLYAMTTGVGRTSQEAALYFLQTNSCVQCSADARLDLVPAMTISFWFRTLSTNLQNLLGRFDGDSKGYNLRIDNGALNMLLNNSTRVTAPNAILTGVWYHVSATYADPVHILYLNGEQQARADNWQGYVPATNALVLGRKYNNLFGLFDPVGFQGAMKDLRLYNRALAPDEIRMLYEWR